MHKENTVDRRRIRLDDVVRGDYIPFLGGRPDRERIIGSDDVVDLVIALNTVRSVEELLDGT